jgi:hypothetical protein
VRDAILHEQLVHVVHHFLCPLDGKTGDDDIAAGVVGLVDRFAKLFFRVLDAGVNAVAIGGLNKDIVGFFEYGRIPEDGLADAAQIAGEQDGSRFAVEFNGQLDNGRAEDMARLIESGLDRGGV